MKILSKVLMFSLICLLLAGCGKQVNEDSDSNPSSSKGVVNVSIDELDNNKDDADYYKQFSGKTMVISNVYAYEVSGEFSLHKQGLINAFPDISCSNMSSLNLQDGSSYTIKGDLVVENSSSYLYKLDNCSIE